MFLAWQLASPSTRNLRDQARCCSDFYGPGLNGLHYAFYLILLDTQDQPQVTVKTPHKEAGIMGSRLGGWPTTLQKGQKKRIGLGLNSSLQLSFEGRNITYLYLTCLNNKRINNNNNKGRQYMP